MKQAWETDQPDTEPYLDTIQTGLLVIGLTLVCSALFGLVLGLIWPYVEGWM